MLSISAIDKPQTAQNKRTILMHTQTFNAVYASLLASMQHIVNDHGDFKNSTKETYLSAHSVKRRKKHFKVTKLWYIAVLLSDGASLKHQRSRCDVVPSIAFTPTSQSKLVRVSAHEKHAAFSRQLFATYKPRGRLYG